MVKKPFLLAMLFVFMLLASGCVTINTGGCCPDKYPAQCTKKAVKVQTEKGPCMVEKADNWVRENLW
jgi:hypothetical protein